VPQLPNRLLEFRETLQALHQPIVRGRLKFPFDLQQPAEQFRAERLVDLAHVVLDPSGEKAKD
jgi:hypothetical protein